MDLKAITLDSKVDICLSGHAGVGHAHSHNGFIQDDSAGLSVILGLIQEIYDVSYVIEDVDVETGQKGSITVKTASGGSCTVYPRRGITLDEKRLAQSIIGKDGIRSQRLANHAFGRVYGQGVSEVAVSLQTAICNATLDSLINLYPDNFLHTKEDVGKNVGNIIGTKIKINGVNVGLVGVVNATDGGIGPNEDLEGNIAIGSKKELMESLGVHRIPTIILEGKVYSPSLSDNTDKKYFLVRADDDADNKHVAKSVKKAGESLRLNIKYRNDVLVRQKDQLKNLTEDVGAKIKTLAQDLSTAKSSEDKVNIVAELAQVISEDCGGISFMSNHIHEVVGGVGMDVGTSAVVSYIVPKTYSDKYIQPLLSESDLRKYLTLIKESVKYLYKDLDKAKAIIDKKGTEMLNG